MNYFITGGAGYLGRHLVAHLLSHGNKVTIYSRDEAKQAAVKARFPEVRCIRGDVAGDQDYLTLAMTGHDVVIHCAATKVVPAAEENPLMTIEDNVSGTHNVIAACLAAEVEHCTFISTDKAVSPTNVYGATKMMGERLVHEASRWDSATQFHIVRYGNVIGSTGSVLPLWAKMLEEHGKITATDPHMTRFWLTIKDAIQIIEYSFTEPPGTILVPAAPAMEMGDFARAFFPNEEFHYAGLRPGEKLHECLVGAHEVARTEVLFTNESFNYFRIHDPALPPLPSENDDLALQSIPNGYTSDNPAKWLTQPEIVRMFEK